MSIVDISRSGSSRVLLQSLRDPNGNRNGNLDGRLRSLSASWINSDYDAFSINRHIRPSQFNTLQSYTYLAQNITQEQNLEDFLCLRL